MNGILCVFAVVIAVAMSVPVDERAVRASAKVLLKLHKLRQEGVVDDDLVHTACAVAQTVLNPCANTDNTIAGPLCAVANGVEKGVCGAATTGIDLLKGVVGILG